MRIIAKADDPIYTEGVVLDAVLRDRLYQAFRKVSADIRKEVDKIIELAKLDPNLDVISELEKIDWESKFTGPMLTAWGSVSREAAVEYALRRLADPTDTTVNLVQDLVEQYIGSRGAIQIEGIRDETVRAVRSQLIRSMETREGIRGAAVGIAQELKNTIGLTQRHAIAVDRLRATLEENGTPPGQIEIAMRRKYNQLLTHRANNIARTETIAARNAGAIVSWQSQQIVGDLPLDAKKTWISGSSRVCPICVQLDGHDPVAVNEAFFSSFVGSVQHPPAHPSCRCSVALVVDT